MCKPLPPPKPRKCRCGHEAVINGKCGFCYCKLLDQVEKRGRNSKLVLWARA